MTQKSFYLDSCIWLNLFKEEGDANKGIPYWKIAKDFIEIIMFSKDKEIVYSGFVLKELKHKLDATIFDEKTLFLKNEERFRFIKATEEDYSLGRKLESGSQFDISFFDCIHVAICKRINSTLVTRDSKLIDFAKDFIEVKKPEDILI